MILSDAEDFLVCIKPAGWATHSSAPETPGYAEHLAAITNQPLKVVHRLDVETSGLLLLAKTTDRAQKLVELFQNHEIQKTYFFFTHQKPGWMSKTYESFIEKQAKSYVSLASDQPNSKTHFQYWASLQYQNREWHLIKAQPVTGKSHQIRLHAKDNEIPILGDHLYGGASLHRLMLFSDSISWTERSKQQNFKNPNLPFEDKTWVKENLQKIFSPLYHAKESRKSLLTPEQRSQTACYRLMHSESKSYQIDAYGDRCWIYLLDDGAASEVEAEIPELKKMFSEIYLMRMVNRGQAGLQKELFLWQGRFVSISDLRVGPLAKWSAEENGLTYILKHDTGFSPGLFLDQRENRKWVLENSRGVKVLNLFSYSGGFSVCAAKGGAAEVCTVDVSANFIQWSKENFEANSLDISQHEFWAQDTMLFLKGAGKRKRQFDLIICDPPSFGRSKEGVFKIERDWQELMESCLRLLSSKGVLIFSTNYEKWEQSEWTRKIYNLLKVRHHKMALHFGTRGADFEAFQVQPMMKSFFVFCRDHRVNVPTNSKITDNSDFVRI